MRSRRVASGLILLDLICPVNGSAATAPAVPDGGAGAPSARDDELEVFGVFDSGDEPVIVVGIDFDWKSQGAFSPPVASCLEATHLSACQLAQAAVDVTVSQTGARTDTGMLRPHSHHHVRAGVHIPRTHQPLCRQSPKVAGRIHRSHRRSRTEGTPP